MIKPRLTFWNGVWWCRRLGVTGCGTTPLAAWTDMWGLYREATFPIIDHYQRRVRVG